MPNGYTSKIYEGKEISPTDFLVGCARGMGYFMHMRDDGPGTPLHRDTHSSVDFYQKSLDEVLEKRIRWNSINEEQRYAEWSDYYNEQIKTLAETKAKRAAMRARYLKMIAEVTAYPVEPLMESTKEFALEMLNDSMEFDCSADDSFTDEYYRAKPYIEWVNDTTTELERRVAYYERDLRNAQDRADEQERYIAAFEKSFGVEVK